MKRCRLRKVLGCCFSCDAAQAVSTASSHTIRPSEHRTLLKRNSALLDTYDLWQLDQQCFGWCFLGVFLVCFFYLLPVGEEKRGCAFCLFRELLCVFAALSPRRDKLPLFHTCNVSASSQVTASTEAGLPSIWKFLFSWMITSVFLYESNAAVGWWCDRGSRVVLNAMSKLLLRFLNKAMTSYSILWHQQPPKPARKGVFLPCFAGKSLVWAHVKVEVKLDLLIIPKCFQNVWK